MSVRAGNVAKVYQFDRPKKKRQQQLANKSLKKLVKIDKLINLALDLKCDADIVAALSGLRLIEKKVYEDAKGSK